MEHGGVAGEVLCQSTHLSMCKRRGGDGGCGAMEACYSLADDLVTGQRKTLVVLVVVVVTVLGALSGLLLGFTLLQQISQHALDTQQGASMRVQ